jgi:hypothetical protein
MLLMGSKHLLDILSVLQFPFADILLLNRRLRRHTSGRD